MNASDLPDPGDHDAVIRFAASFSGYSHFGSFGACADEARQQKRCTIIDLRNELFFFYRAANHQGETGAVVGLYKELLPHFHRLLASGN